MQVFEPFSILGLEHGASDSDIKKAYRRLSIQYHPDKNPDPGWRFFGSSVYICLLSGAQLSCKYGTFECYLVPTDLCCMFSEANKYFVEYISKAYQALTDPISRENFEKYGHPDGRQAMFRSLLIQPFAFSIYFCSWNSPSHNTLKLMSKFIVDTGISNGHCSPSVPARHWWGIWWHTFTLDCWNLYSSATGGSCYLSLKVSKIHRKLCHASYTVHILLLYETFFGPKVLASSPYFFTINQLFWLFTILTTYYCQAYVAVYMVVI